MFKHILFSIVRKKIVILRCLAKFKTVITPLHLKPNYGICVHCGKTDFLQSHQKRPIVHNDSMYIYSAYI